MAAQLSLQIIAVNPVQKVCDIAEGMLSDLLKMSCLLQSRTIFTAQKMPKRKPKSGRC
jgi:hypothetical protein